MTVKELEEALGMTRANIRFYEKEGLLEPERLENGYRDYSQKDLETLRKIKLLRQLQFDLTDIRALQAGEKDLTDALREREAAFGRDMADLEAARALCRKMEQEGAAYADMDAEKYLGELGRLSREGVRFPELKADALPTVNRPWVRFFARSLDMLLCSLVVSAVFYLLLRLPVGVANNVFVRLIDLYLGWGILMVLEPLCLSTWGYTPGKWLFGLKVRDADGNKLTFSAAFERLAGVFHHGEGFSIPIYNLYRNWKSCSACTDGEPLPWENGLSYTMVGNRVALGGVGFVAGYAGVMLLIFVMIASASMPRISMPLTAASFTAGYRDAVKQYDGPDTFVLQEDGTWEKTPGTYLNLGEPPAPLTFLYTSGTLTGVRIESNTYDSFSDYVGGTAEMAIVTLLGAHRDSNPLNWLFVLRGIPKEFYQGAGNWSLSYRGLSITSEVSYSGYEELGPYLVPEDGEGQSYYRSLTIAYE